MEIISSSLCTSAYPRTPSRRHRFIWQQSPAPLIFKNEKPPVDNTGTPPKDHDEITDDRSQGRWFRCVACRTPVAQPQHLCNINSQSSVQSFMNPHGVIHQFRTFSMLNHYKLAGTPTPADSWFPGHWWLYLLCETCHSHLGWAYFTPTSTNIDFFGVRTMAVELG